MLLTFLLSTLLAFVASMPITGPLAAILLAEGLAGRTERGVAAACGGSIPKAAWAGLAWIGTSAIPIEFSGHPVVKVALAATLVFAAIGLWRPAKPHRRPTVKGGFALGLAMTGLNPTLVVSHAAMAAWCMGVGVGEPGLVGALAFAAGTLVGSVAWYVAMVYIADRLREQLTEKAVPRINRGLAVGLCGLAVVVLATR
jgi:threonine/homoserine/homoserine lactone efflux protein